MHRDLKLENLLFSNSKEDSEIKIIDFGLSRRINRTKLNKNTNNNDNNNNLNSLVGTPIYTAPEILKGEIYDEKCDCWSIGVIIYILLCGVPPFEGDNKAVIYQNIVN